MVNGLLILTDGTFQQVGTITSARAIIACMRELIPELERQEREALLKELPRDVIEAFLAGDGKDSAA